MIVVKKDREVPVFHYLTSCLFNNFDNSIGNSDELLQNITEFPYIFSKLYKSLPEADNPTAIEQGRELDDNTRTKVYYCDTNSLFQKGAIEVNHELIRRIVPKERSFDEYDQEKSMK